MFHVDRTEDMMGGKFSSNRKQGGRGSREPTGAGRKSFQELEKLLGSLGIARWHPIASAR